MAWLEKRGDRFRIKFRYGGVNFQHALKSVNEREANGLLGRLEDNLRLLERGKLEPPPDADLPLFLISDGKLAARPVAQKPVTLGDLFEQYRNSEVASKEATTRYTEQIHMDHLERLIGSRQNIRGIKTETLQAYIDARAKEDGRNGSVSAATIQKEIGTFSSMWNRWAFIKGLVTGTAPTKGLVFKKTSTKPPFQTFEQIERKLSRGGLKDEEREEMWECLFLSRDEVADLLAHAKQNASGDWVYPMFAFAAYTGARRSEMLRSQIDDFDFERKLVRIREKKKDQTKDLTFRHVPLSPLLGEVMQDWFARHPGGQLTLCEEPDTVIRATTTSHHFRRTLANEKWKVVRGWHTLRHSFCSNCAARGIDQRIINAWMGHVTEEMSRRYQHLFPSSEQNAMQQLFG